jgi:hypothetical protein
MKSPVYWNTFFYEVSKKIIWRRKKADIIKRMEAIYNWVPQKASVVDVAAGTSRLYLELLRNHVSHYLAIEINPTFVRHLRRLGIDVIQADIRNEPIPTADVIIMIAALYHFKDKENEILDKLLFAARLRVIIIEPTGKPLSVSSWRDRLKAKSGDIGEGPIYYRIEENQLLSICEKSGAKVEHYATLPNNEFIVVLKGKGKLTN